MNWTRKPPIAVTLMGAAGLLLGTPESSAQMGIETCGIPLTGSASGGSLILCDTLCRNARFVTVETRAGESADEVAQRLAEAINESNPFRWVGSGKWVVLSSAGTITNLVGPGDQYMLAGTELGLGIPRAPSGLTCSLDPVANKLYLRWKNPPNAYGSIRLVVNYDQYDHRSTPEVPGGLETYDLDLNGVPQNVREDLDIWVIGVLRGVPSNAAAIHVRGNVQEERCGIPFTGGVAPNWSAWPSDANGSVSCAMGQRAELVNRRGNRPNNNMAVDKKPFYQVLAASRAGAVGGVRRDFLGLSAGHTYRVTIRASTLELARDVGKWSCTLHAAPFGAEGKAIGAEQLAGLAALPDGSQGDSAALAAKFDPQKTTGGEYEECVKDVVVPQGMDSIAAWLKFTSQTAGDKVAVDYVSLEDLGVK